MRHRRDNALSLQTTRDRCTLLPTVAAMSKFPRRDLNQTSRQGGSSVARGKTSRIPGEHGDVLVREQRRPRCTPGPVERAQQLPPSSGGTLALEDLERQTGESSLLDQP